MTAGLAEQQRALAGAGFTGEQARQLNELLRGLLAAL